MGRSGIDVPPCQTLAVPRHLPITNGDLNVVQMALANAGRVLCIAFVRYDQASGWEAERLAIQDRAGVTFESHGSVTYV